jgi:potassium-transporting ATPase potassium-binding subunit
MEGKQTLSGPEGSAVMTVGTMGATAGATGSALDSYTRPAAPGAFIGILLGENSPDGDRGGGLYSILVLALLAVFVAGLMAGRTPEFLGKKIRAPQMKLIVVYALTIPVAVLILGGTPLMITAGTRSILNPGFHGLSEVSYAFRLGGGQQWVRLRRAGRQHAVVRTSPWGDHAHRALRPIVLSLGIAGSLAGARVHARTRAIEKTLADGHSGKRGT